MSLITLTMSVSVFSFVAIIGTGKHSNYNKINGLYSKKQVKTTRSQIVCANTTEELSFFEVLV